MSKRYDELDIWFNRGICLLIGIGIGTTLLAISGVSGDSYCEFYDLRYDYSEGERYCVNVTDGIAIREFEIKKYDGKWKVVIDSSEKERGDKRGRT